MFCLELFADIGLQLELLIELSLVLGQLVYFQLGLFVLLLQILDAGNVGFYQVLFVVYLLLEMLNSLFLLAKPRSKLFRLLPTLVQFELSRCFLLLKLSYLRLQGQQLGLILFYAVFCLPHGLLLFFELLARLVHFLFQFFTFQLLLF